MSLSSFSAGLLTLAALFSDVNARFLRQPASIVFLLVSVLSGGHIVPGFIDAVRATLVQFNLLSCCWPRRWP